MNKYIERSEINRQYLKLKNEKYGDVNAVPTPEEMLELTLTALRTCPTVDVVEVVRCKDCKYWVDRFSECQKLSFPVGTAYNEYCSSGVRIDDTESV